MSIKYDDKTAKLIQNKTIQQYAGGVEIGRIEISTYNIEDILRKAPIADLRTHKNFLRLLYPFLAPLAEGQRAIVMAWGRRPSVRPFVRACVRKLFL